MLEPRYVVYRSRSSLGIALEISVSRHLPRVLIQDFAWHCLGVLDIQLHLRGPRTLLWSGLDYWLTTDGQPFCVLAILPVAAVFGPRTTARYRHSGTRHFQRQVLVGARLFRTLFVIVIELFGKDYC